MTDGFEPRLAFPGADSAWGFVHLAAVFVALMMISRLLRWERQLVPRHIGWTLFGLRTACLVVVLLTLFQPTWAWVVRRDVTGRVVIAVDVSDSMLTTDPQASSTEQLGWAVALGWLDRSVIPDNIQEVARPVKGPPAGVDPRIWADVVERLRTVPRAELARRLLIDGQRPLLASLEPFGRVELHWFGGVDQSITAEQLTPPLVEAPRDALPDSTRLDAALRAPMSAGSDGRVLGLVLMTDGRDLASIDTLTAARQLGDAHVPIFPVLVGSTRRPRDLSILTVEAPTSVFKGDHPKVRVQVSTSGFSGTALDVTLDRADPDPEFTLQSRTITAADQPQVVEFELPAEVIGQYRYVATIDGQPEELRDDNNARPFTIQVVDDRSRVLLVDGEPRWEFRYLEAALSRDERVKLDVVLFQQPYLALLPEPFFPNDWPAPDNPDQTSPFVDRDLVVLGDVSPRDMPDAEWTALAEFVGEQGGTLVLVAGRTSMPLGHPSAMLSALLPITDPQRVLFPTAPNTPPMLRGWGWALTPDGEQQTGLQFAAPEEANRAIWGVLPGATSAIAGRPKPAATVWAWGRPPNGQGPTVPLIVHQYYGLGQVVWIASDSTWRWRFRVGDQLHHRFWGQLARWAATAKLSAGNEFVQFGPLKPQYPLTEAVDLQARWAVRRDAAAEPVSAVAEIRRGEEIVSRVSLEPDAKRPRVSSGSVGRLPAGEYVARLIIGEGQGEPIDAPFSVLAPPTAELADVTANRELLQQLADLTGGKLYEPANVTDLLNELHPEVSRTEQPQEHPLWDRWPMFFVLVGLLTVEWIVRRLNGLP